MTAQTIAILEAYLNSGADPEPFGPEPMAATHCGDTCSSGPGCHYQCDPRTCMTVAWEAFTDYLTMGECGCDDCR